MTFFRSKGTRLTTEECSNRCLACVETYFVVKRVPYSLLRKWPFCASFCDSNKTSGKMHNSPFFALFHKIMRCVNKQGHFLAAKGKILPHTGFFLPCGVGKKTGKIWQIHGQKMVNFESCPGYLRQ